MRGIRVLRLAARLSMAVATAIVFLTGGSHGADGPAPLEPSIEIGRVLFEQRCSNCHGTGNDFSALAPTLSGVIGRTAGSVAGFTYSARFANSKLVWTEDNLSNWLATATTRTPDLSIRHQGVPDPLERQVLLAYLRTLSK